MEKAHRLSRIGLILASLNPKKKFKLNPRTREHFSNLDKSWPMRQLCGAKFLFYSDQRLVPAKQRLLTFDISLTRPNAFGLTLKVV